MVRRARAAAVVGVALARSLLYGPPMDELKHMSVPSITGEERTRVEIKGERTRVEKQMFGGVFRALYR